ncbi:hypothetical protein CCACVL1_19133 [Corchorus capsularis]|uniref:Uncharacterized protein n=1 Tax=Corchorus capsularis TaxID=210143 RepID=A0A1R3HI76_COCAP|nr:hypothetical protein CCACVL1_19133 [Corchorus capsularis]
MEQRLQVEEIVDNGAEKAARFKVKKWGVVPGKRRSVKAMMWDEIVKLVSCLFQSSRAASTSQPNKFDSLELERGVVHMLPYIWGGQKYENFP